MLTGAGLHRFYLSLALLLLHHVTLMAQTIVPNNTSQVYLFLREEEVPIGKVVLSASRAIYLAKDYAKRGVYSVTIEELTDPSPDFYYPEPLFNMSEKMDYFTINTYTGLVKTTRRLDFDDPALKTAGCVPSRANSLTEVFHQNNPSSLKSISYCCFSFQITSLREDSLQIHICIGDINDNAPEWNLKSFDKSRLEHVSLPIAMSKYCK
ncbi:unnamed protein product [Hydatigera taeniaeformis]|uniref:Cadherin domain-containing protein n=1 Tax=Hydatigena taeniaeformis TaxID=6205 RepID=A0A0R3WU11_HYDTA|nr:unnamed protein product [Hydatigera taeniaeformis]